MSQMGNSVSYLLPQEARTTESAPFDGISYELCSRRKDVIMMSADLSKYTQLDRVKKELPDQHLEVGMQNKTYCRWLQGYPKRALCLCQQLSPAMPLVEPMIK